MDFTLIILLFAIASLGSFIFTRRRLHLREGSSALLSVIAGGEMFNGASTQTPGGLPVLHVVSSSPLPLVDSYNLTMVDLPFSSKIHLVGIPKLLHGNVAIMRSSRMEPVVLEGDYPNYFNLYAQRGQQMDSRYVLDPSAMVFTADFCQEFYWEIQDHTLYFTGKHTMPSLEQIDEFVRQIRPAIESSNPNLTHAAKLSYTKRSYRTLLCPFCNEKLVEGELLLECPQGHGCLLTGKQMLTLRGLSLAEVTTQLTHPPNKPDPRPSRVTCPYCTHDMEPTTYQTTSIVIDICSKCGYRWLDTGELANIT